MFLLEIKIIVRYFIDSNAIYRYVHVIYKCKIFNMTLINKNKIDLIIKTKKERKKEKKKNL